MMRVLLIAGSQRRQYNCPGVDGKARTFMKRMALRLPRDWKIDEVDLANVYGNERIQPCNGCVSTSMALCCWPCNCYEKNNKQEPDPSTNLKAMFDRLVCIKGGNPREDLIEHKNPELAMKLEHSEEWKDLSVNHLEGRTAAFFCYGDGGANELDDDGRPKILRHKEYFDPREEIWENGRDAFAPLVWQSRYAGIEVPDELWTYAEFGEGVPYSDNQAEDIDNRTFVQLDAWTDRFASFVAGKGKVQPGRFRAYGYEPPKHRFADLELAWRDRRMRAGFPPADSSPARQQELGLNDDTTLKPKAGE